jgi:hypothetical protein
MNSPVASSPRWRVLAQILPPNTGASHPSRRYTMSSTHSVWARSGGTYKAMANYGNAKQRPWRHRGAKSSKARGRREWERSKAWLLLEG